MCDGINYHKRASTMPLEILINLCTKATFFIPFAPEQENFILLPWRTLGGRILFNTRFVILLKRIYVFGGVYEFKSKFNHTFVLRQN